jgi:hypothetical protein
VTLRCWLIAINLFSSGQSLPYLNYIIIPGKERKGKERKRKKRRLFYVKNALHAKKHQNTTWPLISYDIFTSFQIHAWLFVAPLTVLFRLSGLQVSENSKAGQA